MTPIQALAHHIAQRPEMPRPFHPDAAVSIAWQRAFQWWTSTKERLEIAVRVSVLEPMPTKVSYGEFPEVPKPAKATRRKPKAPCATPEYMKTKRKESKRRSQERARAEKVCCDCGVHSERKRCIPCQATADKEQARAKRQRKAARRALLRQAVLEVQRERDEAKP